MYDTSNPFEWKYYKTVDYPFGQWTITDASLSPDNKFLAYSSIRTWSVLRPQIQQIPPIQLFWICRRFQEGEAGVACMAILISGYAHDRTRADPSHFI
jgi:hypothetical protein